ncbi:hypothetical protein K9N68_33730 [Kovacikia minuta CCNUW1]|uniref:hypothetical protein n=1 Tax=Kovacikia minuta TaxID=2931930 RepID=UPI001CCBDD5F|nr:hypothetical protein [Kovacikia minuta]UBF26404.1 hypothetical protein K9N68_33730 [Kovacikia minuta CCNUW1]
MTVITTTASPLESPEKVGLTSRQVQAACYLVQGYSWKESAEKSGCSFASVKRWHTDPAFRQYIAEGQRQAFMESCNKLSAGCSLAVDVLTDIMRNSDSDSIRCRAAEITLNTAVKVAEMSALTERIAQLEALLNES